MNTHATPVTRQQSEELRSKMRLAFVQLRKAGMFARMSWKCCQSCGWAAVPDTHVGGVVFFHAQDNECIDEDGELYLSFGTTGTKEAHGLSEEAVGRDVVAALQSAGLSVDWNGFANTRIRVFASTNTFSKEGVAY